MSAAPVRKRQTVAARCISCDGASRSAVTARVHSAASHTLASHRHPPPPPLPPRIVFLDILAFSPGSDLSGLFGAEPGTERVFVGEPAPAVLARVEEAARKEGHGVRREGKSRAGPVYVEAQSGGIVAKVTVFKIAHAVSVVEVVKGHGPEAASFWKDWLEPAVKPQAAV